MDYNAVLYSASSSRIINVQKYSTKKTLLRFIYFYRFVMSRKFLLNIEGGTFDCGGVGPSTPVLPPLLLMPTPRSCIDVGCVLILLAVSPSEGNTGGGADGAADWIPCDRLTSHDADTGENIPQSFSFFRCSTFMLSMSRSSWSFSSTFTS
eukprot:PhM_4_TR9130/c0_g1_i1/m.7569